jgi:uncharacterized UBP type Zn finger protein
MLLISQWMKGCLVAGDGSGMSCEKLPYQEKEKLEVSSLVGHCFGMSMGQKISCEACGYESCGSRVEYCLCLTVTMGMTQEELQQCRQESAAQMQWHLHRYLPSMSASGASNISAASLSGLLHEFTRSESLDGFKCEKCNRTDSCSRMAYMKRRPNVLMLYIDRRQDVHLFGKINRKVTFPTHLDLSPWISDDSKTESSSPSACEAKDTDSARAPVIYSLYAMCVHKDLRGSTASGHYVAFVKDKLGGWHHLDDENARAVSWQDVREQQPYILFYMADVPVLPPTFDEETVPPVPCPTQAPSCATRVITAATSGLSDAESTSGSSPSPSGEQPDSTASSTTCPSNSTVQTEEDTEEKSEEALAPSHEN